MSYIITRDKKINLKPYTSRQSEKYELAITLKHTENDEGTPVDVSYNGMWPLVWDEAMNIAEELIMNAVPNDKCWLKAESITRMVLYVGSANIYVFELHPIK